MVYISPGNDRAREGTPEGTLKAGMNSVEEEKGYDTTEGLNQEDELNVKYEDEPDKSCKRRKSHEVDQRSLSQSLRQPY